MRLSFFAALGAISVLLVPSGLAQIRQGGHDFAGAKLTAHPTTSWPTNGGNLYNQRYSPLKAIDRTNVAQLKGVWRTRLRGSGTQPQYLGFAAPLVYDGVAYVSTGANDVFALSIDSGEILWQYEAKLDPNITSVCCGWNNKGVAISEDKVFIGHLDGRLAALDRATGKVAWSIQAERWQENFSITAAPLYVPTGTTDDHHRLRRWRSRHAQPRQGVRRERRPPDLDLLHDSRSGRAGHDTWPKDNDAWKYGGAAIWQTPAVDLDLGLVYFSTGNAAPDYNGAFRAGDNLYAASMLAIELATGKYRWHFQQVHHDIWDYDAVNPVILMDVNVGGRTRKAIAEVGKTGWAYILDRETGKPLIGIDEKPVPQEPRQKTAATQPFPRGEAIVPQLIEIAPEGHALVNDGRIFTPFVGKDPTIVAPGIWGGASWPPSSYDPVQQRMFVCASSVINGYTGGGDSKFATPTDGVAFLGGATTFTRVRAGGDHRGARCDDEQAGVAISVAGAVLQRHAGDRRRAALRRSQRRPADGARLGQRQAALGVPDRRRHARAGEHIRAQRQAVCARVFRRQRVDRIRARRQRVAVRARRNTWSRSGGHARVAQRGSDTCCDTGSRRRNASPR